MKKIHIDLNEKLERKLLKTNQCLNKITIIVTLILSLHMYRYNIIHYR